LLTRNLFLQFLLNIHLNLSKFFSFTENNVVKYYLTNFKPNLQIEKQNLKQIWKRKRIRKRLISAGSGSAGSESGKGGSGSAKKLTASASLLPRVTSYGKI
jgi:hypothetical protein